MKFACKKQNFEKALRAVEKAINSNNTLPVLNNILIRAFADGNLLFAATNLEIAITCNVEADVEVEGSVTVPAKLISSYVQLISEEVINVELVEGCNLELETKGAKTKIKCIDAEEFPLIPELEIGDKFSVDADSFYNCIVDTVFAASLNTSRPILSGVHLFSKGGSLGMVATDSYRLAEKKIDFKVGKDLNCNIPARTMVEFSKILGKGAEGMVEVVVGDNQVLFMFDGIKLISRLIEGRYPDYEKIIPEGGRTTFEISADVLANDLKRVSLFARENNNSVKIAVESGRVVVSSEETKVGEDKGVLEAKVEGDDNSISINGQYLLDVLAVIGQGVVRVMMNDKMSPAVIRPEGDDSYVYIIMPLKI